ncbi:MAG: hypothetical protein ABIQ59_00910 [Nocardioidaceae bacterium]
MCSCQRNGFYASTVPHLLGAALATGELVAPADGPVSWTTHADLAECAAEILARGGAFDGATPPLTAADAVDLDEVADALSGLTGRTRGVRGRRPDAGRAARPAARDGADRAGGAGQNQLNGFTGVPFCSTV